MSDDGPLGAALEKKLVESLGSIEAAVTSVAPEAFALYVKATFAEALIGSIVWAVVLVIVIQSVRFLKHKMDTVKGEVDRMFFGAAVFCAIILGTLILSLAAYKNLPPLISPEAITARDMIERALR